MSECPLCLSPLPPLLQKLLFFYLPTLTSPRLTSSPISHWYHRACILIALGISHLSPLCHHRWLSAGRPITLSDGTLDSADKIGWCIWWVCLVNKTFFATFLCSSACTLAQTQFSDCVFPFLLLSKKHHHNRTPKNSIWIVFNYNLSASFLIFLLKAFLLEEDINDRSSRYFLSDFN